MAESHLDFQKIVLDSKMTRMKAEKESYFSLKWDKTDFSC